MPAAVPAGLRNHAEEPRVCPDAKGQLWGHTFASSPGASQTEGPTGTVTWAGREAWKEAAPMLLTPSKKGSGAGGSSRESLAIPGQCMHTWWGPGVHTPDFSPS